MRARQSQTARRSRLLSAAACTAAATLLVSDSEAEPDQRETSRVELATVISRGLAPIPIAPVRILLPAPAASPPGRAPSLERSGARAPLPIAALDAGPLEIAPPITLTLDPPVQLAGLSAPVSPSPIDSQPQLEERLVAVQPHFPRQDEKAFVPQISETSRTAYIAQLGLDGAQQRLAVRAGDDVLGAVEFQVANGEVSVHVGQVLDLFELQMGPERFAQLRGSGAAREFVSLDRLQSAGIPLEYDPVYDELVLHSSSS